MMGIRHNGYIDYTSAQIWQNAEYEYARMFFSCQYAGRDDLFEGLSIWEEK